jgi:hypothetical protein
MHPKPMSQRAGTFYRIVILVVATAITVSAVLRGRPFVLIALAGLYALTVFKRRRTGHW